MKEFEKKGWFRLRLPDDWEVDEDEEPIAIYHPDGYGALQMTAQTLRPLKPGERIDVFLLMRAFLRGTGVDIDELDARRYSEGGLEWAYAEYEGDTGEGPMFWRLWMATNHDVVMTLTYACAEEDRAHEQATVDEIVKTLSLA